MQGFLNGAPYASAALLGCWLNAPLNDKFGRRGTIFISCCIAALTGIIQAASSGWVDFMIGRLVLGIAVGAKSSTTPIYAAESAPKEIRGALTMMWQMWTAFGIMVGYAASLGFQNCDFLGENSQWRWMIGVSSFPPIVVGALVYLLPDSPRWYMDKENYKKAFESMRKLRRHDIQAARDIYLAHTYLEAEKQSKDGKNLLKELVTVRRNWRAAQSAWFCMFMQQFCGGIHDPRPFLCVTWLLTRVTTVNVIAYYSTRIFTDAGFSRDVALTASFGCGVLNWLGALPAVLTIDRFGRRNLLLATLPLLSISLLWTAGSFQVQDPQLRTSLVIASVYVFMFIYSPGLGPVPFTYSAEAFPLHIRALGMASATAVTWALNFLISFSWPKMMEAMTPTGGFCWYGAWNAVGFVFAYFLVPETKGRTLEELDEVFSVRNRDHALYYWRRLKYGVLKLARVDVEPVPPLYEVEGPQEPKPSNA
jgi:MFS family permease